MRTMWTILSLLGCGPNVEADPEPVEVTTTGDESQPAPQPRSFGGDAVSWIASIRDMAVSVMTGGTPPENLPITDEGEGGGWVEMRDGEVPPSSAEALMTFFEGEVTLTDGNRAEVIVLFLQAGPRLARVRPRSQQPDTQTPPLDPYLEPITTLARSMLADFRAGEGAQHIVTLAEIQAVVNRSDLLQRVEQRLPGPDEILAIEQAMQQPGVELQHIRAETIGVLMRDPTNGALYGVDLRLRMQSDGTHRHVAPPLLRAQRLPDGP